MGELGQRAVRGFIRAIGRMKRDQVITRCGIEMPYLFAGSGQPLLMIHGFADRKETWSLTAPFLALRHQVLCPDLPGYGMAGPIEPSQASLTSQASFLLDFMDALGLESAHLCGNSMGGGVALALAAAHPHRVRSLTLVASVGPEQTPSELRQQIDAGQNPLLPSDWPEYEAMMGLIFAAKPPLPRPLLKLMASEHIARRQVYARQFDTASEDFEINLEDISAPALVIHGLRDRLVHPSTAQALARRIPDTRILLMSAVGHAPQWEQPRQTQTAIATFLAEVEAAREVTAVA